MSASERSDTGELFPQLVPGACLVVPVKRASRLAGRQRVRAITERLLAGQAALAKQLLSSIHHVARGFGPRAFYDSSHDYLLVRSRLANGMPRRRRVPG